MAFDDAAETWELVWMENKLRYIERAETITYNIPGKVDMVDHIRRVPIDRFMVQRAV